MIATSAHNVGGMTWECSTLRGVGSTRSTRSTASVGQIMSIYHLDSEAIDSIDLEMTESSFGYGIKKVSKKEAQHIYRYLSRLSIGSAPWLAFQPP